MSTLLRSCTSCKLFFQKGLCDTFAYAQLTIHLMEVCHAKIRFAQRLGYVNSPKARNERQIGAKRGVGSRRTVNIGSVFRRRKHLLRHGKRRCVGKRREVAADREKLFGLQRHRRGCGPHLCSFQGGKRKAVRYDASINLTEFSTASERPAGSLLRMKVCTISSAVLSQGGSSISLTATGVRR